MTETTTKPDETTSHDPRPEKRRRIERVIAACDLCKTRKVKCDGEHPCSYCKRKNRADTCVFTAPKQRSHPKSACNTPNTFGQSQTSLASLRDPSLKPKDAHARNNERDGHDPEPMTKAVTERRPRTHDGIGDFGASLSPTVTREDHHDDTAVPLEGRILRDAQGKVIFIGDCAPLSFLQTVRHLIASEVDAEGLAVAANRDSIEVAKAKEADRPVGLAVDVREIDELVREYFVAVSSLADLFEHTKLLQDVKRWAGGFTSQQNGTCNGFPY